MNRKQRRAQQSETRKFVEFKFNNRMGPFKKEKPPKRGEGWYGELSMAWSNGWYAVLGREVPTIWGVVIHLCMRNLPGSSLHWNEKQWIKEQLYGDARTAIEVYPDADELVDQANMYHLWILPEGFQLPFTIADRNPVQDHKVPDFYKAMRNDPLLARMVEVGYSFEQIVLELVQDRERLVDRIMKLEFIAPYKFKATNGIEYIWRCPDHLVPEKGMGVTDEAG